MVAVMPRKKVVKPQRRRKTLRKPSWMTDDEFRLWQDYQTSKSDAARNAIVDYFLGFICHLAQMVHDKSCACADVGDLTNEGVLGAFAAIKAFDISVGVKFTSFAALRITGAMLDSLRRNDTVSRLGRKQNRRVEAARKALFDRDIFDPTDDMLARELGVSVEELRNFLDSERACSAKFYYLGCGLNINSFHGDRRDVFFKDSIEDNGRPTASDGIDAEEWWNSRLRGLPKIDRLIFLLYFMHGWTLKKIGLHLTLSESRISQMLSKAKLFLAEYTDCPPTADTPKSGAYLCSLRALLPQCHEFRRRKRERRCKRKRGPRKAGEAA